MDIAATEKNNTPLLSIITINYNNAAGLKKTIESVVAQNFDDYEHIIVDGGSKDGSVDVIKEFLANETYARHVSWWCSEKDNGIYNAMNKGIRHAGGKYCLFLNSGDWLFDENVINKILPQLKAGKEDMLIAEILYFNDNKLSKGEKTPENLSLSYFYFKALPHPSTFIKKELLEKAGLYNENYRIVSDWIFFTDAVCKLNCTYRVIPDTVSVYNLEGISSNSENQRKIRLAKDEYIEQNFPKAMLTDLHELIALRKTGFGFLYHEYGYPAFFDFFPRLCRKILYVLGIIR